MARAPHIVLGAWLLAACSVDPLDVTGKGCPCQDGWTCALASRQCILSENAPDRGLGCVIYSDGKLWCANTAGAAMYTTPSASSPIVNHLRTSYSWFDCWGTGDPHAGGNSTWYYTLGDDTEARGWIPGVDIETPDSFDADPAAAGLARCPPP